jgi:hypothetical protein
MRERDDSNEERVSTIPIGGGSESVGYIFQEGVPQIQSARRYAKGMAAMKNGFTTIPNRRGL